MFANDVFVSVYIEYDANMCHADFPDTNTAAMLENTECPTIGVISSDWYHNLQHDDMKKLNFLFVKHFQSDYVAS